MSHDVKTPQPGEVELYRQIYQPAYDPKVSVNDDTAGDPAPTGQAWRPLGAYCTPDGEEIVMWWRVVPPRLPAVR
jgi:hypothetical protein